MYFTVQIRCIKTSIYTQISMLIGITLLFHYTVCGEYHRTGMVYPY